MSPSPPLHSMPAITSARRSTARRPAPASPPSPPARVPPPAFAPRPSCSPDPHGALSATIIDHPTTTEAHFTNHSSTCSYRIGLAIYRKLDGNINHQELYDYQLA